MQPTKRRILCVDDNEDTCEMLTALLGRDGYEVVTAASSSQALELAQSERFDLYILDARMPDGSGVELCGKIRRVAPDVPVIFYSGAVFPSDHEEGLRAGARAYISKPKINLLTETVRELVG